MVVAHEFHLLRRILWLITLEHDPAVVPGNEHLAPANASAVGCMIPPDVPAQIGLRQVLRQQTVEGLWQSEVERPRHRGQRRQTLRGLQDCRVSHALGAEPSSWHHDALKVCAWDTHQLTLSAVMRVAATTGTAITSSLSVEALA